MAHSMNPSAFSHIAPSLPFASNLSEQLSQRSELERSELGESGSQTDTAGDKANSLGTSLRPSPKARSLSDASKPSAASLSPIASEDHRPSSKDDSALPPAPQTPRRTPAHGPPLNLQSLPPEASTPSSSSRAPLSPKLDPSHIYSASPGSVLPRRSRGLDFSRACTNLHHSIIAESSPDSSPTVGGRGVAIPQRRGSPGSSVTPFSTSNPADRTTISSSMSSVNMMESDTSSSEEDDEPMMGDRDDVIMNTPQARKLAPGFNAYSGNVPSPGTDWMGNYSHAAASLMSFQRARFRKGRNSRHSSSSASGNSSKQSPAPLSPPMMKSIENGNGYFGHKNGAPSRRESLSMGTRDLRLSDMSDDGEHRGARGHSPTGVRSESGPLGVIRRAVTRRGSLLPKTKTFARIRAALMEESAPLDSDAKREAEVVRQVRETEPEMPQTSPVLSSFSSPNPFAPPGMGEREESAEKPAAHAVDEPRFSDQAHQNSAGAEFWDSFDERYRTPPPPLRPHANSSVSEEDMAMDMTPSTTFGSHAHEFVKPGERPASRASTPHPPQNGAISELRKKRRREDDFDPNLFKRRAVSPSMSAQSSPVMPNSPALVDNGPNIWGPPPKSNVGPLFNDKQETGARNIPTTPHTGTLKRVGMHGMNEANDGFMNMSIE